MRSSDRGGIQRAETASLGKEGEVGRGASGGWAIGGRSRYGVPRREPTPGQGETVTRRTRATTKQREFSSRYTGLAGSST
jgi:hypothetical protein